MTKYILKSRLMYDAYKNYEKMFILMPLMHSENIVDGHQLYYEIEKVSKVEELLKGVLISSNEHMDVLKQFGRYPTRNKALGRPNTPEE